MTIEKLLENYQRLDVYERGKKFERLMKNFLLTYPVYLGKISKVYLWNEFSNEPDLGIDLVAETVDGKFWAVQCKFYSESTPINKAVVDSFISNSSRTFDGKNFSARLWIATSDNLTDNAEKTLQNQSPEVLRIGMEELRNAEVDWENSTRAFSASKLSIISENLENISLTLSTPRKSISKIIIAAN